MLLVFAFWVFRPICLTLLLFFKDSVSFTSFVCPTELFIADYWSSFEHFCSSSNLPNIVIANRWSTVEQVLCFLCVHRSTDLAIADYWLGLSTNMFNDVITNPCSTVEQISLFYVSFDLLMLNLLILLIEKGTPFQVCKSVSLIIADRCGTSFTLLCV